MIDDDITILRTTLAAGPTPGPWEACGPSFGDPLPRWLNTVIALDEDGDEQGTVCDAEGLRAKESSADMAYIAAADPARIGRLLDALEAARAETAAAVAAERERCAAEAEHWQKISTTPGHACGQYIAAAIRRTT